MKKKIAIISDVHGNFEALKAVLKDIKKDHIENIICLGDIIGYGPNSEECLKLLLEYKKIEFIIGNHESMYIEETTVDSCSDLGKKSYYWTKERIDIRYKQIIIEKFKQNINYDNFLFTHSSFPYDINWKYAYSPETYKQNFELLNGKIKFVFLGHTHRSQVYRYDGQQFKEIKIGNVKVWSYCFDTLSSNVFFLNTGSVGQARDGATKASYVQVIYDNESVKVIYKKVKYASFITYCKIINFGLGSDIANFLIQEKWRKKRYEFTYNWGKWIFRVLFKNKT